MSGVQHFWSCEFNQELRVRIKIDAQGDLNIAVIEGRDLDYECAFITKEDAAEMSKVLAAYAASVNSYKC